MADKIVEYIINGHRVKIEKKYRTRTQYEWFLTIYMGNSDIESLLMYDEVFISKKRALEHAKNVITNAKPIRVEFNQYDD